MFPRPVPPPWTQFNSWPSQANQPLSDDDPRTQDRATLRTHLHHKLIAQHQCLKELFSRVADLNALADYGQQNTERKGPGDEMLSPFKIKQTESRHSIMMANGLGFSDEDWETLREREQNIMQSWDPGAGRGRRGPNPSLLMPPGFQGTQGRQNEKDPLRRLLKLETEISALMDLSTVPSKANQQWPAFGKPKPNQAREERLREMLGPGGDGGSAMSSAVGAI